MFGLVHDLWHWIWMKQERRLLIIGLDNAGKTTTLEAFKRIFACGKSIDVDAITPTVGLNIGRIPLNSRTDVLIWDVGGPDLLRGLWRNYYQRADGLIFVVDSTDAARMSECAEVLRQVLNDPVWKDHTSTIPLMILANKSEMEHHAIPLAEIQSMLLDTSQSKARDNKRVLESSGPRVSDELKHLNKPYIEAIWPTSALREIGIRACISRFDFLWREGLGQHPDDKEL